MSETYQCQNCGLTATIRDDNETDDAKYNLPFVEIMDDVFERFTDGDVFTRLECPECGAVALPVTPESIMADAAPDLLAVLQTVLRCFERNDIPSRNNGNSTTVQVTLQRGTAKRIRAAIAKATGK